MKRSPQQCQYILEQSFANVENENISSIRAEPLEKSLLRATIHSFAEVYYILLKTQVFFVIQPHSCNYFQGNKTVFNRSKLNLPIISSGISLASELQTAHQPFLTESSSKRQICCLGPKFCNQFMGIRYDFE